MATNAGRPREFRNAAEKQKAYRDRKKQAKNQDLIMSEMLEWFKQQEVSLRNYVAYWQKRDKSFEIRAAGVGGDFGQVTVPSYSTHTIESGVWKYLLLTGAVVFDRKRGWDMLYNLSPVTEETIA